MDSGFSVGPASIFGSPILYQVESIQVDKHFITLFVAEEMEEHHKIMALDFTNIIDLPDYLQFDTYYEPSRMYDKKYAINSKTGEVLGIVGWNFHCGSHQDFTNSFAQPLFDKLSDEDVHNMNMKISTARNLSLIHI